MVAKASHAEQVLLYQLDREVVNLCNMAGAFDESGKPGKGDSSPITIVPGPL